MMLKLYGDIISGNCYKAYLLMSLLDIEHQWFNVDLLKGEAATADFLAKNPNGKIPLLELGDGRVIAESNAILHYLASNSDLIPQDPYLSGKVYEWLFFEQYSHEPFIAVARYINLYLGLPDNRRAEFESKQTGGHKALSIMQRQLSQTPFLVGQTLTIADVALYAYTHVAEQGGFDLSAYPAIQKWIKLIQAQPGYIAMELKPQHVK